MLYMKWVRVRGNLVRVGPAEVERNQLSPGCAASRENTNPSVIVETDGVFFRGNRLRRVPTPVFVFFLPPETAGGTNLTLSS